MKLFDTLDESNIEAFAFYYYNNPTCETIDEFREDLARFKYLKKLINRYIDSNELKQRLILNHLIVLFNVFDSRAVYRLMRIKLNKVQLSVIKPFLRFLGHLGPNDLLDITPDPNVEEVVKKL